MPESYDMLICGAGFAGSLTALCLHDAGFKVCLLEKGQHPRFAIGESSTPVADMILRSLSAKYNLPWLHDFSRYGSWQQSHPEVTCGIKRGFSYFKHYPGKEFATDEYHTNELLVAASVSDMQSDTNWLRSDFDAFLVNKVKEAGIIYFDLTEILSANKEDDWEIITRRSEVTNIIRASFVIDATGSGQLLETFLGVKSSSTEFLTNSFAVFSHFNNVPRWTEMLQSTGIATADFPYDPDNSALHQVLDEGWVWMLRFNTGLTSIGFALNGEGDKYKGLTPGEIWDYGCAKYPSLNSIGEKATLAAVPGKILQSARLQRKVERCFGDGWVALPHTCGFVDPLFSSGIAHSLNGIEKITSIFQRCGNDNGLLYDELAAYEEAVFEELKFVDILVAGCYKTMPHFQLFSAWSMLYFAATIMYEQRRLRNEDPGYFLSADDMYIKNIVQKSYNDLVAILEKGHPSGEDIQLFTTLVRDRIKPVNTAGLMEPSVKNMYRHTTAML
ncbi:MAG TPA: NAD(P)-binding protein [Chitinophagaceae bacterium]|nr:NAD(P)-binding protein [Chitinophagaceae bacterium]